MKVEFFRFHFIRLSKVAVVDDIPNLQKLQKEMVFGNMNIIMSLSY